MFVFKDISSDNMGVFETEHFQIPVANQRTEDQVIPGRHGVVTTIDDGYEGQEISAEVYAKCEPGTATRDSVIKWLQGSGKLILEGCDDRFFFARVSNLITVSQFLLNEVYKFPLYFKCEPFGYLFDGQRPFRLTPNSNNNREVLSAVNNIGTIYSEPKITIKGSGSITVYITKPGLSLRPATYELIDLPSGSIITVDGDTKECYDSRGKDCGEFMERDYPIIGEGMNEILVTGNVEYVEVTPRWRCL